MKHFITLLIEGGLEDWETLEAMAESLLWTDAQIVEECIAAGWGVAAAVSTMRQIPGWTTRRIVAAVAAYCRLRDEQSEKRHVAKLGACDRKEVAIVDVPR